MRWPRPILMGCDGTPPVPESMLASMLITRHRKWRCLRIRYNCVPPDPRKDRHILFNIQIPLPAVGRVPGRN
jgi:hypothetical protein